jgi:hypothetical protein
MCFHKILNHGFLLLLCTAFVHGQEVDFLHNFPVSDYMHPPAEKVFVHTDRPRYMASDTIWFKAYVWYGYNQLPDTVSKVLHADLYTPGSRLIESKKLLIENGTARGEFALGWSLVHGEYTIRAYTCWMLNANCGAPFYTTITINSDTQFHKDYFECTPVVEKRPDGDSLRVYYRLAETTTPHDIHYALARGGRILQSGRVNNVNSVIQTFACSLDSLKREDTTLYFKLSVNDDKLKLDKDFRIPLQEKIDLQFFPEGGNLVNGLESKVAFKAIGTDGLNREISGTIYDDRNNTVTRFQSLHKGMGFFELRPETGRTYYALAEYNGQKIKFALPSAVESGSVMTVRCDSSSNILLRIKSEGSLGNAIHYVVASAFGKIWYVYRINTQKDTDRLPIPAEDFPEGVIRLTVMDTLYNPECERLVYINKGERFQVKITADSALYHKRSRVKLLIETTDDKGIPIQTNLSLAVVDQGQINKDLKVTGICGYKLLESELKGYIEDPGFYFDSCFRTKEIDLLMLTQGYRRFIPDTTQNRKKLQPERDMVIPGQVNGKGKTNFREIDLNLVCWSKNLYVDKINPNSLGHFTFHAPLIYGPTTVIVKAQNRKDKTYFPGVMVYDNDTVPQFIKPLILSARKENTGIDLSAIKERKEEVSKKDSAPKNTIALKEVVVKAKDKYWYTRYEQEAKKVIDLDTLDPHGNKYENLTDLLIKEFGAREYIHKRVPLREALLPCFGYDVDYMEPAYVIDGYPFYIYTGYGMESINYLSRMPVNQIKKIAVLPPGGKISSSYGEPKYKGLGVEQSVVMIETYKHGYRGDPRIGDKTIVQGLDAPRAFYAPKYEGVMKHNPAYDDRATLLWDPLITTDKNGKAEVTFYNSDKATGLEVVVNGIGMGNGWPGAGRAVIGKR